MKKSKLTFEADIIDQIDNTFDRQLVEEHVYYKLKEVIHKNYVVTHTKIKMERLSNNSDDGQTRTNINDSDHISKTKQNELEIE